MFARLNFKKKNIGLKKSDNENYCILSLIGYLTNYIRNILSATYLPRYFFIFSPYLKIIKKYF